MNIQNIAKQTIAHEAVALKQLAATIDARFESAIDIIEHAKGKVVCTGIGKSAIVAQKIVATLNSTGTTAIFMHAADAVHGDLGLINQEDVVIAISKSGETSELTILVPILRNFKTSIIAMTSNVNSYLAIHSDAILFTPVENEADPNNLAPTTSTTVQMAMGDAVAIVLLSRKGFMPQDFAKYHPGGSLGKQLYLKVKDILQPDARPLVNEAARMKEVLMEMSAKRMGATVVLNDHAKITGIITDGDIRRYFQSESQKDDVIAKDIMSKSPTLIGINDMAIHAFQLMKNQSISQVIVHDSLQYLGMIHMHDLLKEGFI